MENKFVVTDRAEMKKKMLEASISKHQTVIDDLKLGIKEMLASQGLVNEEEMDLSQQGFNTEIIQKVNALGDQVSFANEEMKLLYNMLPTIQYIHDTVMLGSVVVTDKDIFFVSASIEEFEVEGSKIFGLSTESPLYQVMRDRKKGETFSFNEKHYKIKEIF